MNANYVIWRYKSVPHACVLGDFVGLEDDYRLLQGVPLESEFPSDVVFHMHADFKTDLLLVDNLLNSDMLIVASGRLKNWFQVKEIPKLEYLRVGIIDHKGRPVGDEYYILHPIDPVDCIDKANSVFKASTIDPDNISSFKKLVIDETRIPADRGMFRLKGFWDIVLVRRDLAEALDQEGFSGLGWLEISDYPKK